MHFGWLQDLLILRYPESISHIIAIFSMMGVDKVSRHYAHSWGWIIVQPDDDSSSVMVALGF